MSFDVPADAYDPGRERDACGLAMVATLRGTAGHDIIQLALEALRHLEHRGAIGSDAGTGDGAGIITQIPDDAWTPIPYFLDWADVAERTAGWTCC